MQSKRMKAILSFLFFISFFCVSAQDPTHRASNSNPAYSLPVPKGWGVERFPLPASFAPSITYQGVEDIRFAPGWGKKESSEYWSYAFLWYLESNVSPDAATLQKHLVAYYTGLQYANYDSSKLKGVSPKTATVTIKKLPAVKGLDQSFEATVNTLDFLTWKPIRLILRMYQKQCSETGKTLMFYEVSPQSFNHPIWTRLHALWKGLKCQQASLIFKNVTIVNVDKGTLERNKHILIEGERIKKISTKPISLQSAIVIDARGMFMIPGLCDFNAEVLNYEYAGAPAFNLLLANGVTSVRDLKPVQKLEEVFSFRNRIQKEKILTPRIYLSGKTIIDRLPFQKENMDKSMFVSSVKEAEKAVDSLIFYGADVIDIRTILNRSILNAITQRARQKGIKVLARYSGNWITASEDGVNGFTHPSDLWRVASRGREKLFRFSEADSMRYISVPDFYNRVLPSLGSVDTAYFYNLVAAFIKNKVWICTNFAGHMPSKVKFEIGDSTRNEYRLPIQKKQLAAAQAEMNQINPDRSKASSPQVYFAIEANKKGVPLLAGTQFEDIGTPGMSLHDELYWLVQGGLSPAEALRAATINPATFLNKQKDLGTVDAGKLADLVLLDANPLDNISNTRKINMVVVNGRLLQRKDLDNLLFEAREKVKRQH